MKEEKTFNFKFNEKEVNKILQGLSELQAKESLSLILKINNEAQQQLKDPEVDSTEETVTVDDILAGSEK
jgi:hypothetical protein